MRMECIRIWSEIQDGQRWSGKHENNVQFFKANGLFHTSLGHRPRNGGTNRRQG